MLTPELETKLVSLAKALINQHQATVLIQPNQPRPGFWFGGGNLVADDDRMYLVGRYRNAGDSRSGLEAGERGLELAIFASTDRGLTFDKVLQFDKRELNVGERRALSIEGSALRVGEEGFELFVSTEKSGIDYPPGFASYRKPGTGVWTIERLVASSLSGLKTARPETVLWNSDPRYLHVKDPHLCQLGDGSLLLGFCTHPYCWTSSNTAFARRAADSDRFSEADLTCFARGNTWDVAMTRVTAVVPVPPLGGFRDTNVKLVFYDGGESLRNLDEHASAVSRPRGYSCEELGGAAYMIDDDISNIRRLSVHEPLFISPHGTGCSRYVSVLMDDSGAVATWQQSQVDLSQPLVVHRLSRAQIESLLS